MTQPDHPQQPVQNAKIQWQDDTPISTEYGDVYFSKDNGVEETRYVFLQNNHLQGRWRSNSSSNSNYSGNSNYSKNPASFTIAETGFGTGLNFLCAAQLWRQENRAYEHLHFVSVEKFPLTRQQLHDALALHPEFSWIAKPLLQHYPPLVKGTHRLYFHEHRISLTLMFGDAQTCFQSLNGVVDAWFLDGFAPSKNPDMWQPQLFTQLARLSHGQTSFSTFTAAGVVKRGLQEAGFHVNKVTGYGRKRDMLAGHFNSGQEKPTHLPHQEKPWFQFHYKTQPHGKAAIVGAGMAGCSAARSLAHRGWQVDVYETQDTIASQGSGNPSGVTFVKPSIHDTAQNRYYQSAYFNATRAIRNLFEHHDIAEGEHWGLNGVIRLAYSEKEAAEQEALLASGVWPADAVQPLTPPQIKQEYNLTTACNGLLLKHGGWLNPPIYCQTLVQHPNIQVHTHRPVTNIQFTGTNETPSWQINDQHDYDAVVLACAFDCAEFELSQHFPLRSIRGQITYLPATEDSRHLAVPVNYDGYINPAHNGFHCAGATFTPKCNDSNELEEDHQWNLNQLRGVLPKLAQQLDDNQTHQGRVGFRCQTPDYLPIVGPAPDLEKCDTDYAPLGKGFLRNPFPISNSLPGLFVSIGHGSRGITSTHLAAEILASYICGDPQPIDQDVLEAIHPARFLIRNIIRRKC